MSGRHSIAGHFNAPKPIHLKKADRATFEQFVDRTPGHGPNGTCHLWTGGKSKKGYGQMRTSDGRTVRANRAAYFFYYGKDAYPFLVRHKCDFEPCVNGEHLEKGTQKQNREDSIRRGRTATGDRNGSRTHPERLPRGEDHWTAKNPDSVSTKHPPNTVNAIKKLRAVRPDLSMRAIGRYFGIPISTIKQILNGETRDNIPYDDSIELPPPVDLNFDMKRKLNQAMENGIFEMAKSGMSHSKIAALLKISQSTVSAIIRKKMAQ